MPRAFVMKSDGLLHIDHDPNAQLPYTWNWTAWLARVGVATISSVVITVDAGLTKVGSASITGGLVTQILQGGLAGTSYRATCHVISNSIPAFEDDWTLVFDCKEA